MYTKKKIATLPEPDKLLINLIVNFVRTSTLVALIVLSLVAVLALYAPAASATERPELVPEQGGVVEQLETHVDLTLKFTDENGNSAPLSAYLLDKRPLVIAPVYYTCPRLCTLTLDGLTNTLNQVELELGSDYRVLSVSFDPEDGVKQAQERSEKYQALYRNPDQARVGWRFLHGGQAEISALMRQLGFQYIEDSGEFIHSSAFMVLAPDGKISRYFYGFDNNGEDVRFALIEAAKGRIGHTVDRILLYCFRFDPTKGRYTLAIWRVVQVLSVLTLVIVASALIMLRVVEKRSQSSRIPPSNP